MGNRVCRIHGHRTCRALGAEDARAPFFVARVVKNGKNGTYIGLCAPFFVARASYPPNSVTSKILPRIRIRLIPVKTTMLIQVNARAKADG